MMDSSTLIPFPKEKTPWELLEFAEKDVHLEREHAPANALSHSHRALESQLDYFMSCYQLNDLSQFRKLQDKMILVESLGLIPNRIFKSIADARNNWEHESELPTKLTALQAIDAVTMFVAILDMYLYPIRTGVTFEFPDDEEIANGEGLDALLPKPPLHTLRLILDHNTSTIRVSGRLDKVDFDEQVNSKIETDEYLYLLCWMLHYHRLEMDNPTVFLNRVKYIREFKVDSK